MKEIKIVGFSGSLRHGSYNEAALRAAKELMPLNVIMDILDLSDIPFYNEDLETTGIPESVITFKNKLKEADAILISTPEYNFSIPAVLKNALDWVSRESDYPLSLKPTAIMSASPSMLGGARVQYHLRQVCVCLNMSVINKPEVFINYANQKFDETGKLIDDATKKVIQSLIDALIEKVIDCNK
jgi:chromate reductase